MTRKASSEGFTSLIISVSLILLGTFIYLNGIWKANEWMSASKNLVFTQNEYWRLWTSLLAHADASHVSGNLLLFVPFAYYLSGYFGFIFFPLAGFFMGGLTNLIVLKLMPENIHLIGVSGVVHWMGAAWMTLAYLIDRREPSGRRLLKSLGVSMILFLPNVYSPQTSYSAHVIGYGLGAISGATFYMVFKSRFLKAEVIEHIQQEEVDFEWGEGQGPP